MKRSRTIRAALLIGTVLLSLTACGASGDHDAAPVPAPGVDEAPATANRSIEQAGRRYSEIVGPPNCAGQAFAEAAASLPDDASVSDAMAALQPLAATAADAYGAFHDAMTAAAWPGPARAAAEAVTRRAGDEAGWYRDLADATDEAAFSQAWDALVDGADGPRPSGRLRAVLGLDGNQRIADAAC